MQRITISIDDDIAERFETMTRQRAYRSRSEAMRDIVRDAVERWRQDDSESRCCVANLSYVFDRRIRNLASRLSEMQHAHHELVAATMLVRLDHHHSLESVMLKGPTPAVRNFADLVTAERGVRFGHINLLGAETGDSHGDPEAHAHDRHVHFSPGG